MDDLRLRAETLLMRGTLGLPRPLKRVLAGRPLRIDGLELDIDVQLVLRLQRLARIPQIADLPMLEARDAVVRQSLIVGGRPPVAAYRDLEVSGADGPLPARLYTPTVCIGRTAVPTVMYFHGGGWMYGDLASHDATCRVLAESAGVQLLAVEYRLSPEHAFPHGLEDCRAAYRWLVANAADVGADPSRLAVAGDSAGGSMATNVAVTAADEGLPLALQLLIYPGIDFVEELPSRDLFQDHGLILTRAFIDGAREATFGHVADLADPDVSPLRRASFPDGMVPAHVVIAGFDPLRDEGEAYADLLRRHGVRVDLTRHDSMVHGFVHFTAIGDAAPRYVREIGERLGAALS